MTEKRFTVPKNYRCIQDNLTKEHYLCEDKTEAINLTYLLNDLADENEQLKEENEQLKYIMNKFKEDILIDMKNNIEIYPKKLMEYWCNVMEKIGGKDD